MEGNAFITIGLPISLFIIMVGMGFSLVPNDFRRVVVHPKSLIIGLVIQWLVVPLLGLLIAWLMEDPQLAIGIALVAALPGGTTSNLCVYLARGNLALSIALTLIASVVAVLSIPFYMEVALAAFAPENAASLRLPWQDFLLTVLAIVVVPVSIGMVVRFFAPVFAQRAEKPIGLFATLVLVVVVIIIVISEWSRLGELMGKVWMPVVTLNLVAIVAAVAIAVAFNSRPPDTVAIAVEAGIKNTTLGMTIALSLMHNVDIAIPSAVYGLVMYASVAILIHMYRGQMGQEKLDARP